MARKPREFKKGYSYHIGGKLIPEITLQEENLAGVFKLLEQANTRFKVNITAFNIEKNHYHFCVHFPKKTNTTMSKLMHWFNTNFAIYVNKTLDRKGRVLMDRYWSKLIKSVDQLKTTVEYIINNSLKHYGILAEFWKFCSYNVYYKKGNDGVTIPYQEILNEISFVT